MTITLTQPAIRHIAKMLARRGRGLGVRIGVKTTGCSGLAYVLEYVDSHNSTDVVIDQDGITVFVDQKTIPYLMGVVVDHVRNGLNEGFQFINPNERDRCGCGESFRV